ncbi:MULTISPECIES: hypothetical protein [unclassified Mesorhizobium]|uniref:hypothetical protein n=1 Tax=unclassified Mesorhizobium TaxID=325217 RepID=UPI000FCA2080|nr:MULTISPECIES: hypothetical protein [unclassified Mesorhizobium]TGP22294.1 hypothetical protein EN874_019470 [Mesorhizobium sp. M1D.F.Ca.ET.231.01.1.1]TGP24736.1 hypothetical protein EN877_30725 [Mesorhizobium sp. M1D.F.Ca.ET.234.01.1.1]TGS37339.1 hypothetical protein EN827_31030 [Mesorhizobium sp. M1D.F.Ca.ET.184.01.1.1]TGS58139.1 hypothetical protein EN826_031005 [Mesorhizobium sp. M1D.F.Ca.ET.183.01.1.1]
MITVKKPFNTPLRRWKEGDTFEAGEVDLAPHTLDSLKAGQFIAVPATKAKADAAPALPENSND